MKATGKLLSCWVIKRRHRATKAYANHTFRNCEATLTLDAFSRMVVIAEVGDIFQMESTHAPEPLHYLGTQAWSGNSAHLRCGQVSRGDVVMLDDRRAGFVQKFVSIANQSTSCLLQLHNQVSRGKYALVPAATVVVPVASTLAACIWSKDERTLTVLAPPISATWGHEAKMTCERRVHRLS